MIFWLTTTLFSFLYKFEFEYKVKGAFVTLSVVESIIEFSLLIFFFKDICKFIKNIKSEK